MEHHNANKKKADKLAKWLQEEWPNEENVCRTYLDSFLNGKVVIEPKPIAGISFCVSTNGAKPEKTNLELSSIHKTMQEVDIPYEVIIAGDTKSFVAGERNVLVHTPEDAHNGLLAKLRNNAAEKSQYDVIVFVDDDFIFDTNWAARLLEHSAENGWDILANKILLPDRSRFWDRATMSPHVLVDYDYPEYSKNIYQTGGFWIMRKEVYEKIQWDSNIPINAAERGSNKINEDIDMTLRCYAAGYVISFDEENTVWHNDENYIEFNNQTLLKNLVSKQTDISYLPSKSNKFKNLIAKIKV